MTTPGRPTTALPAGRTGRPIRRPARLLILLGLLVVGLPAAGQALPGGPLPEPLLAADNWWNLDVSRAPVDPASDALLDFVGRGRGLHPDFGGDAPDVPEIYGMPYVSVPGDQPLVPVTFVEYGDESDAGATGRPPGYPIPPAARYEPGWIEGGHPGAADVDGDRHLLLVDRDRRLLYELYHAHWNEAAGRWEAGSGAVWPLDRNHRRPEGWTSADAAGLAILPGLVRYDEVFGSGPIRHAFRVTVPRTDGYVWPASHRAGNTPGAPPLGTRLRLKAGVDLSSNPPEVRKIFQAMKTYGLIVADNGSAGFVQGTYDRRWDNDVLNPAFRSLTLDDFEVIQLGWRPASGPDPGPDPGAPCIAGDADLCLGADGRFRVSVAWATPGSGSAETGAESRSGSGHAVPLTADTGAFWFFQSANLELVVKVLDGCGVNAHHWFFAAGLTNVEVEITVTDTATGATRRYVNPQGRPFQPIQDTRALGCS